MSLSSPADVKSWTDAAQDTLVRTLSTVQVSESEQIRRALAQWLHDKGVLKTERKRAQMRKRC